jgi:hypothetical protein
MSMLDNLGDDDKDLKDAILQSLIDKMEDIMGSDSRLAGPDKGMAVQVQAPDKEGLQEGLAKAGDVLDKAPEGLGAPADDDQKSDDERLAELLDGEGGSGDEEDEEKKRLR